jgi:hypothetical protein
VGCRVIKRPLKRPRRRWNDNIRMDLKELRWMVVEWIHLDQDRNTCRDLVDTIMMFRLPQNVGKFLISWKTRPISFSRRTVLSIATILLRDLAEPSP